MTKMWFAGSPENGYKIFSNYAEALQYYNNCHDIENDDAVENGAEPGDEHMAVLAKVEKFAHVADSNDPRFGWQWKEEVAL